MDVVSPNEEDVNRTRWYRSERAYQTIADMALRWQARLSIAAILFMCTEDTLSLGDRTMDTMDRHGGQGRPRNQMLDPPSNMKLKVEPTFDYSQNTNVTALIGKTAYLTCRVRNLGDKSVSWVRHRDIHILTAGAYTYTSDQRFQALHRQNTGQNSEWSEWTLCIKWAQERDQGLYECQISTIPVKSHQFRLNVVIPTATILGGPDLYVGAGSTINLTCAIHFSSEPPAYIFWYYNEHVLSYDSPRGGVSVITEKGGDVTTSWLLIQTAQPSDSGEYSCKPSNANTASIKVHVLNEKANETNERESRGRRKPACTIVLVLTSFARSRHANGSRVPVASKLARSCYSLFAIDTTRERDRGKDVVGEYTIKEPGGNIRTVKYRAGKNGFFAHVFNSNGNDHDGGHHH
ncbi:carcinoembryonic antigen-related cell adhesion molecule 2-like isoform X4 [Apis cerana]|uniref:carcinoembryonic antigen-related cell adhesion molecule 2-like isoform X4 n=1 Tax=Apis cerana TaxID=7461 RepID=UPI002B227205|nr:carcinoembryonic antigen-related cell adhesion molecule 2-like isoform X4 [Apis cerana]